MKFVCLNITCLFLIALELQAETEQQALLQFFQGRYDLIGVLPDSNTSYKGMASFQVKQNHLAVSREIDGMVTGAKAYLEKTRMADEQYVLRIRFRQKGIDFEETCLFRPDLDNYARFSCYLYRQDGLTKRAGMEAYFIAPD